MSFFPLSLTLSFSLCLSLVFTIFFLFLEWIYKKYRPGQSITAAINDALSGLYWSQRVAQTFALLVRVGPPFVHSAKSRGVLDVFFQIILHIYFTIVGDSLEPLKYNKRYIIIPLDFRFWAELGMNIWFPCNYSNLKIIKKYCQRSFK